MGPGQQASLRHPLAQHSPTLAGRTRRTGSHLKGVMAWMVSACTRARVRGHVRVFGAGMYGGVGS